MAAPSFIELVKGAAADLANAAAGAVRLFVDVSTGDPSYKDESGTVTSLQGAAGTPGTDGTDGADAPPLTYLDHGDTGSSEDIDFSAADVQRIVLNSATVALSTSGWPAAGIPGIVRVYVQQDGVGGRFLSYSAEIDWGDPGEPTLQTGAGKIDVIDLETIDGGTTVLASMPNRVGPAGATGADGADGISGGAVSIPYTFSTTTTDADPGAGNLRLSNATQNAATTIRADLLASDGTDWTAVLATLADSTNTVKGHLRLYLTADPTKWLLFTVSAVASPSGYKNITVVNVGSSAASPFSNADPITLAFSRAGDAGAAGTASVSTDGIWDAAGDLAVGTGADTAGKLSKGASGTVLTAGASTLAYAFPPGHEFAYAEKTNADTGSEMEITATTESGANTIVSAPSTTYSGDVMVEMFVPLGYVASGDELMLILFDGGTSLGRVGDLWAGASDLVGTFLVRRKLVGLTGTKVLSLRGYKAGTSAFITAGPGGAGHVVPAYIRVTQA